jgi:pimeloyl-ACP methyl ester carboxylesterase
MKRFRRFMVNALLLGVLSFLVVPFLIPEPNSGTLTNVEAAGPGAEFSKLNGIDVHVKTQKYTGDCKCDAPLIVLMHGFGASTFSWRKVIEPLGEYGQVIAYDRPAFGFTERPSVTLGVDSYGFEANFKILDDLIAKYGTNRKVVLVGHSAGGQLAAEYTRLNPAKVQGLILVDAAIVTTGGSSDGLSWLYQIPQIDKLGPILVSSIAQTGDDLLRRSHFDQAQVTDEVYEGYHQPLKVKGWERAFWKFATASRKNDLLANLGTIKTPTLLISGVADTVVPVADQTKLKELIPGSELVLIEKSAHLPQEEQPEAFVSGVKPFMKDLANG